MERASAEILEKALLEALLKFGLTLQDIRGITTDAAFVMQELGRNLKKAAASNPFYHQLCFAHGIHLAVLDTFFEANGTPKSGFSDDEEDEPLYGPQRWQLAGICESNEDGELASGRGFFSLNRLVDFSFSAHSQLVIELSPSRFGFP